MIHATPPSDDPRVTQRWSKGILAGRYLLCQWKQDELGPYACTREGRVQIGDIRVCAQCGAQAKRVATELIVAARGIQELVLVNKARLRFRK